MHILLCVKRSKGNIWCLASSSSTLIFEIGSLIEHEVWGSEHRPPLSWLTHFFEIMLEIDKK